MRINNGKNDYLFCNLQIENWQDVYETSEEAFKGIKEDIINDCTKNGYTISETKKVLSHYEILLNNANT